MGLASGLALLCSTDKSSARRWMASPYHQSSAAPFRGKRKPRASLPQPLCQQRGKMAVSEHVSSNLPQRSETLSPPPSPDHWTPKGRQLGVASCLLNGPGWAFLVRRWEHRGCCSSEENSWHKRLALAPGWTGGQVHKGGTRAQGLHQPLPLVYFPLEVTLSPLSPGLCLPFLPSPQPLSSFLPWGWGFITPAPKVPGPEYSSASPQPGGAHSQIMQWQRRCRDEQTEAQLEEGVFWDPAAIQEKRSEPRAGSTGSSW